MIIGNLSTESLLIALSGIVIVFIMLAGLSGMIVVISKVVSAIAGNKPAPAAPVAAAAPAQAVPAPMQLEGVNDLTAACIMAIVSDESGIPLEQLKFRSIKAL